MRRFLAFISVIGMAIGIGCSKQADVSAASQSPAPAPPPPPPPPKAELLFRNHFAGFANLRQSPSNSTFKTIAGYPATTALRESLWPKLARTVVYALTGSTNGFSANSDMLLEPLLDDAFQQESFVTAEAIPGGVPDWVIAVKAGEGRTALWSTNVAQLFTMVNSNAMETAQQGGFTNWTVTGAGGAVRFASIGSWVMMGGGTATNAPFETVAKEITANGRPAAELTEDWLVGEAALSALTTRVSWLPAGGLSKVEWNVSDHNQRVRPRLKITGSKPLVTALPDWQVPTNTIRDEGLISFTALRGLNPLLDDLKILPLPDLKQPPGQFYFWAQAAPQSPFFSYAAALTDQVTNALEQVAGGLPPLIAKAGLTNAYHGQIVWATNRTGLIWNSLIGPGIFPFLRPVVEPAGSYLVAGLIPLTHSTNAVPPELIKQVIEGRTNLVCYDWESSEMRSVEWLKLSQLLGYLHTPYNTTGSQGNAHLWVLAVSPLLEDTITEVAEDSPTELSVKRSSRLGLNSVELVTLAHWIDALDFPFVSPSLVYRPADFGVKLIKPTGAPMPPAPTK